MTLLSLRIPCPCGSSLIPNSKFLSPPVNDLFTIDHSPFTNSPFTFSLYLSLQTAAMAKLDAGSTLQRLRNRYRLVVMNDDTYEEVVTFRLSRMSVYVVLSTIFVLLVGLTVALIVFTPLKLYIPGYQSVRSDRQYRELMYQVDSLKKLERQNAQYIQGIQQMLSGNVPLDLDTTQLNLPPVEEEQ